MRVLFIFVDGVGLGPDDPPSTPFARFELPAVARLLEGRRLVQGSAPFHGARASLLALDAGLGTPGLPQSATGQATLLTGRNVSAELGEHYGPKPNPPIRAILTGDNLFAALQRRGLRVGLLNAYPARYFQGIESGRRLYSAIPQAAVAAGLALKTQADLFAGLALSADLTGQGWREQLNISTAPLLDPAQAGRRLASLAQTYDFAFFEYWLSDYAGHRQDFSAAQGLLATLDAALGGLAEAWPAADGLALITSDHGNLEDLGSRRHTHNRVPALLLGAPALRRAFAADLNDLSDVAPAILRLLGIP